MGGSALSCNSTGVQLPNNIKPEIRIALEAVGGAADRFRRDITLHPD